MILVCMCVCVCVCECVCERVYFGGQPAADNFLMLCGFVKNNFFQTNVEGLFGGEDKGVCGGN